MIALHYLTPPPPSPLQVDVGMCSARSLETLSQPLQQTRLVGGCCQQVGMQLNSDHRRASVFNGHPRRKVPNEKFAQPLNKCHLCIIMYMYIV